MKKREDSLKAMSREKIMVIAESFKISGYRKYTKEKLIDILLKHYPKDISNYIRKRWYKKPKYLIPIALAIIVPVIIFFMQFKQSETIISQIFRIEAKVDGIQAYLGGLPYEQDAARKEEFIKAQNYFNNKKYSEAIRILQELYSTEINEDKKIALLNLTAIAYFQQNDLDKAEIVFKESLKQAILVGNNQAEFIMYKNLGRLSVAREEFVVAIDYYKKCLIITPSDSQIYFNIGVCYHELHNYYEAYANYKKATECKKDFHIAYYMMGKNISYFGMKNLIFTGKKIPPEEARELAIEAFESFLLHAPPSEEYMKGEIKALIRGLKKGIWFFIIEDWDDIQTLQRS